MKNKVGLGIFYIIVGILLSFGPKYIFLGCTFNPDSPMKCWWSTQTVLGIGFIFIAAGICYMIIKSKEVRLGISLMSILVGMLGILIPKVLIGGCKKATMACLALEFPCIYLICTVGIITSIINIVYLNKCIKGNR